MIQFVIVGFAIFVMVKAINSLKKKQESAPAEPLDTPKDVLLLREIRYSLAKQPRVEQTSTLAEWL